MKGLSKEIELALNTIIEGLNYNFFSSDGTNKSQKASDIADYVKELEPEKMKKIMESKTSSFNSAKKILDKWIGSPNAPSKETIRKYINSVIKAGESALKTLRIALSVNIDFDELDAHKHDAAIKAKPIILESIFDLSSSIDELKGKIESDDLTFTESEFEVGFPEKFARGELIPLNDYHKNWYNEEKDAVRICPFSTKGNIITIHNLNIQLPTLPKKKSDILFYKKPKEKQFWQRLEVPKISNDNKEQWIDYIKEEYRRRKEGVWFYNNGEPVYLTGNHYFALQWCKMLDTGTYMDFRYAQLNMFYHLEACIVDSRCLGQLFVKSRRTGFTFSALAIMLNSSTSTRNNNFGMTSKSNTDASKAFLKYRYMLLNLPFFFLPLIKGKLDSPNMFEFSMPADSSKEAKKKRESNTDLFLNNLVDYQPTTNDSYDGQAMFMYLGDEAGKWEKPHDYLSHLGQITPTMLQGGNVVGKAFIGSTVGGMKKGGEQFKEIYKSSDVRKRNKITQMTSSGLYSYFLPAQDNMEAYTDMYGVCHKTKPKNKTINTKGVEIKSGSLDHLLSEEKQKKKQNDISLNEQFRAYPRTIEHAFRDEASNSPFNITKIYEQLEYNESLPETEKYTVGNFDWSDGIDSDVVFHPNSSGRFKISWLPSEVDGTLHFRNNVREHNGYFYPNNKDLVRFGADPFSYKSTHGKGSKGGIHGKTLLLSEGNAPNNKFVVEYIARPPDETIFFEDAIKCVRFYGSPILVESNKKDLLRHMLNRGYRGFCMNRLDRPKHKLNPDEIKYGGQMMAGKDILDSHISAIGTWIQNYVGVYNDDINKVRNNGDMGDMPFEETLKDWLAFDPDKRTDFDATISSGLAIMACMEFKYKGDKEKHKKKIDISSYIKKYDNTGNIGRLI